MGRMLLAGLPPAQVTKILGQADLQKRTRHTVTSPAAAAEISSLLRVRP